jgi:hypothetical protein
MAIRADIRGLDEVRLAVARLGEKAKEVDTKAQSAMAAEVWNAEKDQMRSDLDRPTPFSVGALRYKKAGDPGTFGAPRVDGAAVYMANAFAVGSRVGPDEWLGVQIVGGTSAGPKRSERVLQNLGYMPKNKVWVPARGVRLDAYGNVRGSTISAMLSNLGANPYGRSSDPSSLETKFVLVGPPGDEEGVFYKSGQIWKPFLWFVDRQSYRERFEFYERADREIAQNFNRIYGYYLDRALKQL